jgi:glycosyltransferase involved in cell wall biosynthesis
VVTAVKSSSAPTPQHDGKTPLLSIALPVYNGERYLAESLDALLAQTFTDFALIISDNASTDGTAEICQRYAAADPRIRYVRQPVNIGAAPNHNVTLDLARAPYFKWASDDDLYEPTLIARCLEVLQAEPDVVLAHAFEAFIDENGVLIDKVDYRLVTDDPDPAVRFRSLLCTFGGDDFYGVMRTDLLRQVAQLNSYHNADRTFMAEIVLQGRFVQVPELLYYRRDHPGRAERAPNVRARAANLDPRRASRWRHPRLRLHIEYIVGFFTGVWQSDISLRDRVRCTGIVVSWLFSHLTPGSPDSFASITDPAVRAKAAAKRRVRARRTP